MLLTFVTYSPPTASASRYSLEIPDASQAGPDVFATVRKDILGSQAQRDPADSEGTKFNRCRGLDFEPAVATVVDSIECSLLSCAYISRRETVRSTLNPQIRQIRYQKNCARKGSFQGSRKRAFGGDRTCRSLAGLFQS